MKEAHAIEMNHAIGERERREAKQRYDEARIQHDLLLESSRTFNSDFYTYRYLASQGFLPGYNFPRLPLMAFLPARREKIGRDGFLSRPRFLGLSEFGPQSIIYHEGSTYRVRKAILGLRDEESVTTAAKLPVRSARLCPACGYAHCDEDTDCERCVQCHALLDGGRALLTLYRIEQVSTRRATRITSDEEERQRQGYEMMTTIRFAQADGRVQCLATRYSEGGVGAVVMAATSSCAPVSHGETDLRAWGKGDRERCDGSCGGASIATDGHHHGVEADGPRKRHVQQRSRASSGMPWVPRSGVRG